MEQERDPDRPEVYERIPWEALEKKKGDRQWMMFAVAGAVVLGALAYSFVSNRPQTVAAVSDVVTTITAAVASLPNVAVEPPLPIPANTVVVSEADLYAIDPERLIDQAVAHAEWFIAEYFTIDGSEQHAETLASLTPAGIPLPSAPEGTRVFVESVSGIEVTELEPLRYEVSVLVRYLLARGEEVYMRQPPTVAKVEVVIGDSGPRVVLPPEIQSMPVPIPEQLVLGEVPDEVGQAARALLEATEIVGGTQMADGSWRVIVLAVGTDGVTRPVSVLVP